MKGVGRGADGSRAAGDRSQRTRSATDAPSSLDARGSHGAGWRWGSCSPEDVPLSPNPGGSYAAGERWWSKSSSASSSWQRSSAANALSSLEPGGSRGVGERRWSKSPSASPSWQRSSAADALSSFEPGGSRAVGERRWSKSPSASPSWQTRSPADALSSLDPGGSCATAERRWMRPTPDEAGGSHGSNEDVHRGESKKRRLVHGWHRRVVQAGGKKNQRGQWWRKVQIGHDFVPDTQDGGGEDFIFLSASDDEGTSTHGGGSVQGRVAADLPRRQRSRYPLLPSLVDQLRKIVNTIPGGNDSLLKSCGISISSTLPSEPMVDDELLVDVQSEPMVDDELLLDEESEPLVDDDLMPGSMFRSSRTAPVTGTTCSPWPSPNSTSGPPSGPPSAGPPSTPPSAGPPPCATGLTWEGRSAVVSSTGPMSSTSKSGGPFRSNIMVLMKGMRDEKENENEEENRWDEKMKA